ncbi:MAG: lysophospholipid acyltransferase family protein [Candidatus Eremiobacteraeota bacterium]|nr:lysophospholipid acyltransferase family protein [Candidatus Eremiobacteraeota bacterium]
MRGFERFFGVYITWFLRSSFAGVWIRSDAASLPDSGYIAVGNHSSWWDGFVPFALHRAAQPQRPFAIMMHHEQLVRFPIFRWGGAFSVDARSPRSAKPAVDHAAGLAAAGCGVCIFPQGALCPPNVPLVFTSAFAHAASAANAPVVPVAMRFVFRRKQRPEILVDIGGPFAHAVRGLPKLAEVRVSQSLAQIDRDIAEDAVEERYRLVFAGSKGIDDRVASALRLLAKHD